MDSSLPSCNTTIKNFFDGCIVIICAENISAMFSSQNSPFFTESYHTSAVHPSD